MNEQVRDILNQRVTKTSKIQQLLLLGLTRRQVADLITNGNYGFVYNVYKKMLEEGHFTVAASPAQGFPELDYTFTRRFGVEIEAYNCSRRTLASALQEEGINVAVEGYNHVTGNHWKIVGDSSLVGSQTFELVSPILEGEAGLAELKKVTWVLDFCGAKVNNSCGLHIHFDAAGFNLQTWKNIILTYKNIESLIDCFMPESRRNNTYCKRLSSIDAQEINRATTISSIQEAFGDRYYKVNVKSYSRHRTIEFRQHGGTTDFDKMENWIRFLNGLITFAGVQTIPAGINLNDLPFLNNMQKCFLRLRTKKLSR